MASRAVEGTGTRGREHRRGQRRSEETEDAGPFVVRVDDGRKKKKGETAERLVDRRPEERRGLYPVAPSEARP